jgi:hypothetical protein
MIGSPAALPTSGTPAKRQSFRLSGNGAINGRRHRFVAKEATGNCESQNENLTLIGAPRLGGRRNLKVIIAGLALAIVGAGFILAGCAGPTGTLVNPRDARSTASRKTTTHSRLHGENENALRQ